MDLFLTFTCNQKKHFGVKKIRNWIDSGDWKQHFPCYVEYTIDGQKEINTAIEQSAASLLLRNWMETKILFIKYLLHSKSSCLKSVSNIFARDEYQKDAGNLPHIHAMISIDWKELNQEQKSFVEDLVSASVCDIVPTKDVASLIEKGIMKKNMNTMKLLNYQQIYLLTFAVQDVLDAFQMVMVRMHLFAENQTI